MKMRIKLLLAGLLALGFAPRAHAQPEGAPDPSGPEAERESAEATHFAQAPEDPSAHFNFFNFSYRGKDEYGGPFGDGVMTEKGPGGQQEVVHEEEPMSPPFVLMLVNFGIFLLLLAKYLWPPAQNLARERHDQIKSALDEAAHLRDKAAAKLAEYETRIKDVDAEIAKLVDGIRADAEADKARILETAKIQAEHMKRDAELRIAAEIELARHKLAAEISAAATAATEKLLRDKTTPDDQRKLVGTFISGMEAR